MQYESGSIGLVDQVTTKLTELKLIRQEIWRCVGYPREPASVTLDIDDTCDVVHGHQQLSLFNAHYDERCFLPIHVYDTEKSRPVAVVLRPGKTPGGVEVIGKIRMTFLWLNSPEMRNH